MVSCVTKALWREARELNQNFPGYVNHGEGRGREDISGTKKLMAASPRAERVGEGRRGPSLSISRVRDIGDHRPSLGRWASPGTSYKAET